MPGLSLSAPSASSSSSAVFKRYKDLQGQLQAHRREIQILQERAIRELPDELADEDYPIRELHDQEIKERAIAFLSDTATIFRCLRRCGFDSSSAFSLLHTTLRWRLRTDIDSLSLDSLHPIYVAPPRRLKRPPLLWLNAGFLDTLNRPVALITLRSLERTEEGGLADAKEYIAACLEVVRRRIAEIKVDEDDDKAHEGLQTAEEPTSSRQTLQCSFIFDLAGSTSTNFELELLPFLLDILRNHYPSLVSSVHVLNFGWVHSGIWALAKRLLPRKALEKVYFVGKNDLVQAGGLFESHKVPKELGGKWDISIEADTDDVMSRLARPRVARGGTAGATGRKRSQSLRSEAGGASAPVSPAREAPPSLYPHAPVPRHGKGLSRAGSFESLTDNYFSTYASPRSGHSRAITPGASGRATPAEELPPAQQQRSTASSSQIQTGVSGSMSGWGSGTGALRMTLEAANKLRKLQMTRGGGESLGSRDSTDRLEPDKKPASGEGTPNGSPIIRRSRSLRDFRLWEEEGSAGQGQVGQSFIFSPDEEAGDSDTSGKAGEANTVARSTKAGDQGIHTAPHPPSPALKFFRRWTGLSQGDAENQLPEGSGDDLSSASAAALSASHSGPTKRQPLDPTNPPRFLSHRTRKFSKVPGTVSPYNSSNPFWGYPAYLLPSGSGSGVEGLSFTRLARREAEGQPGRLHDGEASEDESYGDEEDRSGSITPTDRRHASSRPGISPHRTRNTRGRATPHRTASYAISGLPARQRQMAVRRRWRDLLRTLIYLFALRILSLNRHLRSKVASGFEGIWGALMATMGCLHRGSGGDRGEAALATAAAANEQGQEEVEWRQRTERHRRLRAAGAGGRTRVSPQGAGGGGGRGALRLRTRSYSSSPSSALHLRKREMAWMVVIFALTAVLASRRGRSTHTVRGAVARRG